MNERIWGWVVLVCCLGACDAPARRSHRGDGDEAGGDGAAGPEPVGGGGTTAAGGGAAGGAGAGASTSTSSGGAGGGPDPACQDVFAEPCGGCLADACCGEVSTCLSTAGCFDCVTGGGAPGCDAEPAAAALFECAWGSCQAECFDDPGGGDGVGATVAECQGTGTLDGTLDGEQLSVQSGFAAQMQGQMNVFLFDRPFIDALNLPGNPGEYKMRLLIGNQTGPNEYGGLMGVSKWDPAQSLWVDLATPTDLVVVTVAAFGVVDPVGLMCNGELVGHAEAVFEASTLVGTTFAVPVLTADFP